MAAREPTFNDMFTRQGLVLKNGGLSLSANGYVKGGQTSYNVGTGFFLGYSGATYKLSIGNPAGNRITWDGTTLSIVGSIALGSAVPWSTVTDSGGKPADYADVTLSAVNGGLLVTGGGITLSGGGSIKGGKTGYANGTTGFFLGYAGGYVFDIGSTTNYFRWTGTAIQLVGDISGTSNITIDGQARFMGNPPAVGGIQAAVHANELNAASYGVYGQSSATLASHGKTGYGGYFTGSGTEAYGLGGQSQNRTGVSGYSAGSGALAIGVRAASDGGYGLYATSNSSYSIYCVGTSYFGSTVTVNGTVAATTFTGALTGNVTGNVTGSSGSCTGNAASATTAAACSGNAATASSATYATRSGEVYNSGNCGMYAGNAAYSNLLQTDGNMVIRDSGATVIWSAQFGWVSDGRQKKNIRATTLSGLQKINQIRIVDFEWKEGHPLNDGRSHTGVVSQELLSVIPEAVGQVDDTLMIDKGAMVPYLVKAVQELSEQVKSLQIEIQALKSK
jgi:hypothetical protein